MTSLILNKKLLFEGVYYVFLRKLLRKNLKKNNTCKIWVFLKPNYPISKKSKNSRMGKGVGSFLRWATQLNPNFVLLKTYNLNHIRLIKIKNSLKRVVGLSVSVKFFNFFR
jgi:ribosomal protein L16/L10AE